MAYQRLCTLTANGHFLSSSRREEEWSDISEIKFPVQCGTQLEKDPGSLSAEKES